MSYWWPAFSLGVSVEYDHASRQRGSIKANASIDVQGLLGAGDLDDQRQRSVEEGIELFLGAKVEETPVEVALSTKTMIAVVQYEDLPDCPSIRTR